MQAQTHLSIDRSLCGEPLSIEEAGRLVDRYERAHRGRRTVLGKIEQLTT